MSMTDESELFGARDELAGRRAEAKRRAVRWLNAAGSLCVVVLSTSAILSGAAVLAFVFWLVVGYSAK